MLMTTLGCSSNCAHCCFACEPEKRNLKLNEDDMISYIEQAHGFGIKRVSFTGGEPLLLDLGLPMAFANDLGMHIDVRTNAYWAKTYDEAYYTLYSLYHQGLRRLGLSYDSFHAQYISKDCITNALRASRELNIPVYLDWIGSETYEQVREYLNIEPCELRYVGLPLKVGKAVRLHSQHFRKIPVESFEGCASCIGRTMPILTIFPGDYASYHPCCWVNPALIRKIGDNGWIRDLAERTEASPMTTFLREHGIGSLIKKARNERPELLKLHYSHECEVCYDLLGNLFPEEVQELPQYIRDFRSTRRVL